MEVEIIATELLRHQLPQVVPIRYKMDETDMYRLARKLSGNPFHPVTCVYWNGRYANNKASRRHKGIHIKFFLNQTKFQLHRVMYANYVGEIDRNHYLKCKCCNPSGVCFNVNHYELVEYNIPLTSQPVQHQDKPPPVKKRGHKISDQLKPEIEPVIVFDISFN